MKQYGGSFLLLTSREWAKEQEIILLREQLAQRDALIKQMQEQITALTERVQALEARLSKNSCNSHLPPTSDRFVRQPKSLRKKSGKKAGGQEGHPGKTLLFSSTPDKVVIHPLDQCPHCQETLQEVPACGLERRQVLDLPEARLVVVEHQAVQKRCPTCEGLSTAVFPPLIRAPIQYGLCWRMKVRVESAPSQGGTRHRPYHATASQAGACMAAKERFFPFTRKFHSLCHSPTESIWAEDRGDRRVPDAAAVVAACPSL